MKILSIIILSLLIFTSCSNKQESNTDKESTESVAEQTVKDSLSQQNSNEEKEVSEFQTYLMTLDKIPLPLQHDPNGHLPELSRNYDKMGFSKFKHRWCSQPLGILYQNEESVGIIDCSIGDWGLVPFLMTYNLDGDRLDSASFYKKSGMDMGYEAMEYLTFSENRKIVVLDTVKRWEINEEEGDIVEGSMKKTTGRTEYNISTTGKITQN